MAEVKLPKSVEYMRSLGTDPHARAQFKADPHEAMTKAGLSHEEIAAVLSKNPAKIHAVVKKSLGTTAAQGDFTVVLVF
jgi:hypothetical protein